MSVYNNKRKFVCMDPKKIEAMKMDAEAYLHGDGGMVDRMNAPLAKLEFLGISTEEAITERHPLNFTIGRLRGRTSVQESVIQTGAIVGSTPTHQKWD